MEVLCPALRQNFFIVLFTYFVLDINCEEMKSYSGARGRLGELQLQPGV